MAFNFCAASFVWVCECVVYSVSLTVRRMIVVRIIIFSCIATFIIIIYSSIFLVLLFHRFVRHSQPILPIIVVIVVAAAAVVVIIIDIAHSLFFFSLVHRTCIYFSFYICQIGEHCFVLFSYSDEILRLRSLFTAMHFVRFCDWVRMLKSSYAHCREIRMECCGCGLVMHKKDMQTICVFVSDQINKMHRLWRRNGVFFSVLRSNRWICECTFSVRRYVS